MKSEYSSLQWKIYFRIALIAFCALLVVAILELALNNRAADWIVSFLQNVFNMNRETAHHLYQLIIRNNMDYLVYAAFGIFFIILARFLLMQFAKYFKEISSGLDILVQQSGEIKLSPEMAAMEKKLTAIKQTLEKRELEAVTAEQRKNDVVMYMAHDIKTPLTSVIGYLSLLHESPDIPREQKEKYIRITLEKANHLEKLVDEFFEITRYSFHTEITRSEIDLCFMLAQMTDEFFPLLSSKGKEVLLNIPEDLTIHGDAEKLARVFNNILKNAVAYSTEREIKISAALSANSVSISFTNSGVIPKEKLDAVFTKFYRLDSARSTETGGAGIGLAIAKEIVSAHGGKIFAESDGGNTTFTVELPIN